MPALRDTFGEWKKCRQPEILLEKPVTNPATTNRPPTTSPANSGEFGFEITPGGTPTQPSGNGSYPPIQPTSPQTSYPTQPNPYPPTETTTYPTTQPTYPPTQPTYPTTQPTKPSPQPPKPAAGAQYYTVMQGETLWAISRKFSLTVDQLKQMNGLADNTIKPGQQLRIK